MSLLVCLLFPLFDSVLSSLCYIQHMVARKRQTQVESFQTIIFTKGKTKAIKRRINCSNLLHTITSERVNRGVCEARVHVCYQLRNSLGGYGGIRVIGVSDDLGGSSSCGWGGIVAKSAVVHSRWCVKNLSEFR